MYFDAIMVISKFSVIVQNALLDSFSSLSDSFVAENKSVNSSSVENKYPLFSCATTYSFSGIFLTIGIKPNAMLSRSEFDKPSDTEAEI